MASQNLNNSSKADLCPLQAALSVKHLKRAGEAERDSRQWQVSREVRVINLREGQECQSVRGDPSAKQRQITDHAVLGPSKR